MYGLSSYYGGSLFSNYNYGSFYNNTNRHSSSMGSLLNNYSSINSSAYRNALKNYYSNNDAESFSSKKINLEIKDSTKDLMQSASALTTRGRNSVFYKTEQIKTVDGVEVKRYDYDKDAIEDKVEDFVDDYNSVVQSAGNSNSSSILSNTLNLTKLTKVNKTALSKIGITVQDNNQLKVDKTKLKNADVDEVKKLFNGSSSYAAQVTKKAASIYTLSSNDINNGNSTYNREGASFNAYSYMIGNYLNGFF